jgi:CRP-like cAMP-binding protein
MVKLSLSLPGLEERVIALHGPGAWFGEGALLLDEPHLVTATSLEDSKLAHIPSPAVLRCLRQDKTFALRLLAETLRRLRAAMLDSTAAGWSSARQRVIGFLLDKTATAQRLKDQITIELPAAKQVVASRLNLTPETLSRVFRELSRDGLVIVDGLRILIPSMGRLQAIHEEGDGVRKKGY